ncbi:MAG: flagellar biosynthetic protein FliO [Oscillospiraceae bacterium]|nr:flagellar biosynthetic protein FliO [Oscillospiraceae bacterium]
MGEGIKLVFSVIGVAVIIFAAYFVTWLIGTRHMKMGATRDIRVRDRFAITKDKSFVLVQSHGRVYFVALTNNGATLLDTYDAEEFTEADNARTTMSFKDAFAASLLSKINPNHKPRDGGEGGDGDR